MTDSEHARIGSAEAFVPSNERQKWIDNAKGLAILLVVSGHVIISAADSGLVPSPAWSVLFFVIYTIHMPVFMFLAGFCARARLADPHKFLGRIAANLLWPYVLWTTVFFVSQSLVQNVRATSKAPPISIDLVWTPVAWLWFIAALMIFHLLAVVLRRHLWVLLLGGVVALPFTYKPTSTFAQQLAYFLIFYASGVMVRRVPKGRHVLPVATLATVLSLVAWLFVRDDWTTLYNYSYWSFPALPASALWVVFAVSAAKHPRMPNYFAWLGRRSFGIYLTHIYFIVAVRIVCQHAFGETSFALIGTLSSVAGVSGPLLLMRAVDIVGLEWLVRLGHPQDAMTRPSYSTI